MSKFEGLDKGFKQVRDFHEAFGHPVGKKVQSLDKEASVARTVWTGEELVEFLYESADSLDEFDVFFNDFLDGLEKVRTKIKANHTGSKTEKVVGQSDALVDALYFIFGTFVQMGVQPDELFTIVHDANMSKLFTLPDGTKEARYRESDGKILKSPDFQPPEEKLERAILSKM